MPDEKQTLYERIGGKDTITSLIGELYRRVVADAELEPFFKDIRMEKFNCMQREFFNAALEGPITFDDRPLAHIHHGMGITKHHYALFVDPLLKTLESLEIEEGDVHRMIARVNTYADEITGVGGSAG